MMINIVALPLATGEAQSAPPIAPLPVVAAPASAVRADDTAARFDDVLMNSVNPLVVETVQPEMPLASTGAATPSADNKKARPSAQETPSPLQLLLDALLLAGQPPVTPLQAKPIAEAEPAMRTGEKALTALATAQSPLTTAQSLSRQQSGVHLQPRLTGLTAKPAIGEATPSFTPVVEPNALPEMLLRELKAVVPQPLTTPSPVDNLRQPASEPAILKLAGETSRWGEQLQLALGERLQLQVKNQIQHATIRLDPPAMGKIDISMQLDQGRMQVHIQASQGEVYRLLQQGSDALRQNLNDQHTLHVTVQIFSQSGQQQSREQAHAPVSTEVLSADGSETDESNQYQDESILLTI